MHPSCAHDKGWGTAMPNAFVVHWIFAVSCVGPLSCWFLCRALSSDFAVDGFFVVHSLQMLSWAFSLTCVLLGAHGNAVRVLTEVICCTAASVFSVVRDAPFREFLIIAILPRVQTCHSSNTFTSVPPSLLPISKLHQIQPWPLRLCLYFDHITYMGNDKCPKYIRMYPLCFTWAVSHERHFID
jgi:hypothetical protein